MQPRFSRNIIAASLSMLHSQNINLTFTSVYDNRILGGQHPLSQVMGHLYNKPNIFTNFRRHNILFLSQLTSFNGTCLLRWTEPFIITHTSRRKHPLFIKELEKIVLLNPTFSRKMDPQFYTKVKSHTSCVVPDIWAAKKKEWVAIYNHSVDQVLVGRVIFKCKASSVIYVEH